MNHKFLIILSIFSFQFAYSMRSVSQIPTMPRYFSRPSAQILHSQVRNFSKDSQFFTQNKKTKELEDELVKLSEKIVTIGSNEKFCGLASVGFSISSMNALQSGNNFGVACAASTAIINIIMYVRSSYLLGKHKAQCEEISQELKSIKHEEILNEIRKLKSSLADKS